MVLFFLKPSLAPEARVFFGTSNWKRDFYKRGFRVDKSQPKYLSYSYIRLLLYSITSYKNYHIVILQHSFTYILYVMTIHILLFYLHQTESEFVCDSLLVDLM